MKVVLAGGGTAGHINPALAIAQIIRQKRPDAEILFIGNRGAMEDTLVTRAGFSIRYIKIQGLDRRKLYRNFQTVRLFLKAVKDSKQILREFQPDIVVGTGGYVSGPVMYAASKLGLHTCIHEQNAYPGVTSRMLSGRVEKVFISFEDSRAYFKKKENLVLTGNPLRAEFSDSDRDAARRAIGLSEDDFYVLSFGGSLGAEALNRVMTDVIIRNARSQDFAQCHAMGKLGVKWMPSALEEKGATIEELPEKIQVKDYIYDMPRQVAAADIMICRAGAITLGEITAQGKAAILIPSPNVTHNHQYHNAMSLAKQGAAVVIKEKDLTADILYDAILSLKQDPDRLKQIRAASAAMGLPDAAETIWKNIREMLR